MSFRDQKSGREFPRAFQYHWQHFTVAQLADALKKAGFKHIYVYEAIEGEETEVRDSEIESAAPFFSLTKILY